MADTIEDIGQVLAPIASVKYVHNRKELERKKDIVDPTNTRMSPDLQLVSDYISNEKRKAPNLISPPKKKIRTSSRAKKVPGDEYSNRHISLPSPQNGNHYRKPEVVKILSQYPHRSTDRGKAVRKIIRLSYVPCTERTILRLMERNAKNPPILDSDWTSRGRPEIYSDAEMVEMAQSLESYSGRGWKENDIAKMLTDLYAKKIKDAGHVSLVPPLGSREHLHIRELRSEGQYTIRC